MVPGDRAHAKALLDAFREVFDIEPDLEGVQLAGMLDAQITRQLLEKHQIAHESVVREIEQVISLMGDLYTAAIGSTSLADRRLPGVMEVIDSLTQFDVHLGTLTGNARRVAEVKLGAAELGDLTRIGGFGDRVVNRSDLVGDAIDTLRDQRGVTASVNEVVLIGDTPQDIDAARCSGAAIIAVATGRYDERQLHDAGANLVLPDLTSTHQFLTAVQDALDGRGGARSTEWSNR